jgi:cholesterol oxidase
MRFDVIIVGSGFGGSVCAARLAERGMRVLVLERGPWWGPHHRDRPQADRRDLPRGAWGARKLLRNVRMARKRRRFERLLWADGLLEIHRFDHLNALTGSGVGGGSHIYTGVLDEPPAEFFDSFPPEVSGEGMHPYFERVRRMLRPSPIPRLPQKDEVFEVAVRAAGVPAAERPDLAIVWGQEPDHTEKVTNAVGVEQSSSTWRGDAFVGCEDGSKTTLDLTYLPTALRHGAEIRPLCEVLAVGLDGRDYRVRYVDHRVGKVEREVAPRLILAAGGLNTQRLLFDAKYGHGGLPRLPSTLGRRFSPNADFAAFLWRTALVEDSSRGPSVGVLSRITTGGTPHLIVGQIGLPVQALPVPPFLRRRLQKSTLLFCMGRNAAGGTIEFDGRGLVTSIGRSFDAPLYDEIETTLARVAGHFAPKRLISPFLTGKDPEGLFTVHPLGGCSMGKTAEDGFTDHRGEVFGHPGLFIADGSIYPRSPGTAPSMTIAALAERQATLIT